MCQINYRGTYNIRTLVTIVLIDTRASVYVSPPVQLFLYQRSNNLTVTIA
jgi:hypothetical protein